MEIAKYIGLFILKNKYCSLQGLGNVEIKRLPTQHNNNEIAQGVYYVKFDTVGSIDDNFPSFVANNEQVSIAKASNEISNFIKESKQLLNAGNKVEIPSIGYYVLNNGVLSFELNSDFSMPTSPLPFPVADKVNLQNTLEEEHATIETYNNYTVSKKSINWGMVSFWGIILLIGGAILAWGIQYFFQQQKLQQKIENVESQIPTFEPSNINVPDSLQNNNDSLSITDSTQATPNVQAVSNSSDSIIYSFFIKKYNTESAAQKRKAQLESFNYNASIIPIDSNTYNLLISVKTTALDTSKIIDSFSKNFGSKVIIYNK